MSGTLKVSITSFLLLGWLLTQTVQAAPREAGKNDGAVLKLQAMVKTLTGERDAAKAEFARLEAEVEQLKKNHSQAVAAKEQLGSELSAQKNSNGEVRTRLDQTHAKLLEAIEKHKQLSQEKNQLGNELAQLKTQQESTAQQLSVCGQQNVKLYQSAKELLERYQSKGSLAGLLQDEPLLQFNSVEMETIMQDYQDKLSDGRYKQAIEEN